MKLVCKCWSVYFTCVKQNTLRRSSVFYIKNCKYFLWRSTGCVWFDVVHSFNTTSIELDKKYTSNEVKRVVNVYTLTHFQDILNYIRAAYSLQYNAFNYVDASMIVFLAPIFYPLNENSTESTMVSSSKTGRRV